MWRGFGGDRDHGRFAIVPTYAGQCIRGWAPRIASIAPMYIDIVPNRGSPPAILLRESIREGKRVRKRTIANLSALPIEQAEMIRRVLKGEKLGPLESVLE